MYTCCLCVVLEKYSDAELQSECHGGGVGELGRDYQDFLTPLHVHVQHTIEVIRFLTFALHGERLKTVAEWLRNGRKNKQHVIGHNSLSDTISLTHGRSGSIASSNFVRRPVSMLRWTRSKSVPYSTVCGRHANFD